jgi:hypothetical protein
MRRLWDVGPVRPDSPHRLVTGSPSPLAPRPLRPGDPSTTGPDHNRIIAIRTTRP